MDADWVEVSSVLLPAPGGQHAITSPVASLAFDSGQELLWAGNEYGRVTSFCGTELQRYTGFRAHPAADGPVRQFLFHDKGVIVLGARNVHMALRRGVPLWNVRHPDMTDMRCMSFTSKGTSEILVAGLQDVMFVIDVNKGEVVKQVPTDHHYTIMRKSRHICAATKDGNVNILDAINLKLVKTWNAHSSYINDMDVQQDFIVTCGASIKHQAAQTYMLDSYVNVFDLKNMISMSPVPFPPLAAYVRMHPRMVTTGIVVSEKGQMHVVDLMNPNTSSVWQANVLSFVKLVEIAPSGEALALADSSGYIHLWGSPNKIHFAEFAAPVEFIETEETHPPLDWTTETPLNTIGLPYYRETLLSSWPSHIISDVGAPPVKYEPNYLATLQQADFALYGRNTRGQHRNQVEKTRAAEKSTMLMQAPKFLSEKARESAKALGKDTGENVKVEDVVDALTNSEIESHKADVPLMYSNVEIKYSKFGVDDFDFGFYNKTKYAGLENHIPNAYANALLQVMHYTPLIRNLALQHAATNCLSDQCLLCELGFIFDMLQKAAGSTCQASNLLKVLSYDPQAGSLGLLDEDHRSLSHPLTVKNQTFTRFLLDKVVADYQRTLSSSSAMDQTLATAATDSIRCMNCRNEFTRPGSAHVIDLMYPMSQHRTGRAPKTTFSQVLKLSVERETTSKGWCRTCQRYQPLSMRRSIRNIPGVLVLNCAIMQIVKPEHRRLWATPGWLPEEIGIIVDQGQFFCYEGEDLKLHLQRGFHNITVYSLVGFAVHIDSGQSSKSHLVSMVNVAHSETTPPNENKWHLFNDFLVRPVSTEEALTFNTNWKMPSVLTYQIKTANNQIDTTWKDKLDTSVLFMDPRPGCSNPCQPLRVDQKLPGPSSIIAIDTEFVAIKNPEIEVNSEGERETIRPMTHALARVSVVRGQGEEEGTPFIDDYIAIQEPIVDYLTLYSGIEQGDLDPRSSRHNLVSLKTAYRKLWVLLNLGCRFLGHGLKQDFRVINIQVPQAQIIDTIELFFLRSRLRRLSLAFLAWYLLKEDIQQETHDSIEDARTALKLYRKALEFEDAGVLDAMLQDIYRAGRDTNYKAPRKDDQPLQRTATPPIPMEGANAPLTPGRKAPATPSQGPGQALQGPGLPGSSGGASSGSIGGGSGSGFGSAVLWTPSKGSPLR